MGTTKHFFQVNAVIFLSNNNMKKILLLATFITITSVIAEKLEKDEGIYILNEKNYDEGPKQFKYLLVYFYAPWCGHCKAFGPELFKAGENGMAEYNGERTLEGLKKFL